ncbi:hypothetical protein [Persephonella sp. KM09-Lau-8]|uniref:hypothetical protein n=1 Tax=Persephonella sp. KM09-Lau-8 TaxID=1158345 RepID=UPI0018CC0CC3|nr:hypothetical protein [Persephonella sp. KM09-Lau-8]
MEKSESLLITLLEITNQNFLTKRYSIPEKLEVVLKQKRFEEIQKSIEEKFVKNLEKLDLSSKESFLETFPNLWKKKRKFEEHVRKRIEMGHISLENSELFYAKKIIEVLATAEDIYVEFGEAEHKVDYVKSKDWIVILGKKGKIETAYKLEINLQTLLESHKIKYEIQRGYFNEEFRKAIKSLWNRVKLF